MDGNLRVYLIKAVGFYGMGKVTPDRICIVNIVTSMWTIWNRQYFEVLEMKASRIYECETLRLVIRKCQSLFLLYKIFLYRLYREYHRSATLSSRYSAVTPNFNPFQLYSSFLVAGWTTAIDKFLQIDSTLTQGFKA